MGPCLPNHQPRKWAYIAAYSDTHNTLAWQKWPQCCCTYIHWVTLLSTIKRDMFCCLVFLFTMFYCVQVTKHLHNPEFFLDTCILIRVDEIPCQCALSFVCCILKPLEKESLPLNPENYKHITNYFSYMYSLQTATYMHGLYVTALTGIIFCHGTYNIINMP